MNKNDYPVYVYSTGYILFYDKEKYYFEKLQVRIHNKGGYLYVYPDECKKLTSEKYLYKIKMWY